MTVPVWLTLPTYGPFLGDDLDAVVGLARRTEAAGFAGALLPDHVVMGVDTSSYPFGTFPYPPDTPWLEPLTALAVIAGATTSLRLSTGVLALPTRPAALVAKTAATLDVLSKGRLDLAVGTGWQAAEFAALGADHAARGRLLDEGLATCRAMWEGDDPVDGVWCRPRPAQQRLHVLVAGGLHRRTIHRVVTWGDGWVPLPGAGPDEVAAQLPALRLAWADAGRDAAALRVRVRLPVVTGRDGHVDLAATLAGRSELADAGATECYLTLTRLAATPGDAGDLLDEARRLLA